VERENEVNSLLGAGETHRETARIANVHLSTVTRHSKHSKEAIAAHAAGGTPEQIARRKSWLEILEIARQRGDAAEMRTAQKRLDEIAAEIAAAKPKPRRGPSNVPEYKASWNLCRQCLWLEQLGYHALPSCSTEAYRKELTAKLMAWLASESEAAQPKWDLIGAAAFLALGLCPDQFEWPEEYGDVVAEFRAALVDFQPAKEFAGRVRTIESKLQEMQRRENVRLAETEKNGEPSGAVTG
jgi:transposase